MFANLFGIKEAATNKSIQPSHIVSVHRTGLYEG
jgi:hypothetical protein